VIRPIDRFCDAMHRGYETAEQHADALITFGIKPTSPHTGYGYAHRGTRISDGVYEVRQFKEKPSLDLARQYVASGEYSWNSGMFVWRISAFLAEFARNMPESHEKLGRIASSGGAEQAARMKELYPTLKKISVDFAIMEKAARVLTVEMNCDWLDVGSWTSLEQVLSPDAAGNISAGASHRTLDAGDNILVAEGDHLIAAIGVKDLVVIAGPKATLVCHKNDAQRIKDIVAGLEKDGLTQYL